MRILKEKFAVKENVTFILRDKNGKIKPVFDLNFLGRFLAGKYRIPFVTGLWKKKICISNLIVNTAFAAIAGRVGNVGSVDPFGYLAMGTGSTAAVVGDTALETEITTDGGERSAVTPTLVTTTVANDTLQFDHTFTFTGPLNIIEFGIFNDASAGIMFARVVRGAIHEVIATDNLQVIWQFRFT